MRDPSRILSNRASTWNCKLSSTPPGRQDVFYYNKAHNIRTVSEGAIQVILQYSAKLPTSVSNIALQQMHGAASRAPANEPAFPHRYDHFDLLVHPVTDNPADTAKMIQWAWDFSLALQPFVEKAVYVNALEDSLEEGALRVREAYGVNYERLTFLKKKYDPMNQFRLHSNIKPALPPPAASLLVVFRGMRSWFGLLCDALSNANVAIP